MSSIVRQEPVLPQYYVTAVNGSDGSILWNNAVQGEAFNGTLTVLDCVVGQTQPPSAGAPQAALFVNAGNTIYALNTADGTTLQVVCACPQADSPHRA